jgi:hypothetical protein
LEAGRGNDLDAPTGTPASHPDDINAAIALAPIGTRGTSDSASVTVTGRAVHNALFRNSDLDLTDWSDLTETIDVLPG